MTAVYEAVVQTIRRHGEFPTGRLAKSTVSIMEKLRRESIRLSQMQDIAGCRIVVKNVLAQEKLVASLRKEFPEASIIDRRDCPSYGYRAIHISVKLLGKPIEIQVRSLLQHLWAEVSEKSSDVLDPAIKYGGGPDYWRKFLIKSSEAVEKHEDSEKACDLAKEALSFGGDSIKNRTYIEKQIDSIQQKIQLNKNKNIEIFTRAISWLDKQKGQTP